jgi:uncharacterized protein (TIGR02246 family)
MMTPTTDEAQIRELIERWAAAVRAKDTEGAVAHHTADIVMFDVPMPLQSRGIAEYRDTWKLFFDNSPGGPGSFDVTELRITASETVAFAHALVNIVDATVRLTVGLRKENERWRIAHEHHSYPLSLSETPETP